MIISLRQNRKNNYTTTQFYIVYIFIMEETIYRYNGEYAVKYTIPVTEETKDTNVELYDKYNDSMVDVSQMTAKDLVSLISEIWGTWRNISEEEYNQIVNS